MPDPGLRIDYEIKPPIETLLSPQMAEEASRELRITTQEATKIVRSAVIEKTPHALGTLRNSILIETIRSGSNITGSVLSTAPYAQPVECGSRPHWAPIGPLILWVQRKLGGAGSYIDRSSGGDAVALRRAGFRGIRKHDIKQGRVEDVARRVQYKIAKRGTKGHWMFRKGFEERVPTVIAMFESAMGRLLAKWGHKS